MFESPVKQSRSQPPEANREAAAIMSIVFYSYYQRTWRVSDITNFSHPLLFSTLVRSDPLRSYGKALRFLKLESSRQPTEDLHHFWLIHPCDRRTERIAMAKMHYSSSCCCIQQFVLQAKACCMYQSVPIADYNIIYKHLQKHFVLSWVESQIKTKIIQKWIARKTNIATEWEKRSLIEIWKLNKIWVIPGAHAIRTVL